MIPSALIDTLKGLFPSDRFSIGTSARDLHSVDESFHPPCPPDVVLWPTGPEEVQKVVGLAHTHRVPVTAWGAGSSLEGNPIPVRGGIVLDFSLMNHILDLRLQDLQVDVEPGVIYQDLNEHCRPHGLFFPPDPGARATIGGMIGNNASGTRTVKYGATRDYVQALEVVLADGSLVHLGTRAPKSSSGYDLCRLFVGSEGTLGIVTRATLRLTGFPEHFLAAVASFSTPQQAADCVHAIMISGLGPAALELLTSEVMRLLNAERGLGLAEAPTLFMEFHGTGQEALTQSLEMVRDICRENGGEGFQAGLGLSERNRLWEARHQTFETIKRAHPGYNFLIADTAVPISQYPEMVEFARGLLADKQQLGYVFGHAGDGNLHLVLVGKRTESESWEKVQAVNEALVHQALQMGGTATGEHGIGIGKRLFMESEHGASLALMRRVKELFDPDHILNPGKMFF
jgi:D-lactate dehydrogenase (cytochrome)